MLVIQQEGKTLYVCTKCKKPQEENCYARRPEYCYSRKYSVREKKYKVYKSARRRPFTSICKSCHKINDRKKRAWIHQSYLQVDIPTFEVTRLGWLITALEKFSLVRLTNMDEKGTESILLEIKKEPVQSSSCQTNSCHSSQKQ